MSFLRRLKNRPDDLQPFGRRRLHMEHLDPRRMLAAINLFDMDPSVTAEEMGYTVSAPEQGAAVASASASAGANGSADAEAPFAPDQIFSVNPEDRIVGYFDMGGTPSMNPACRKLGFGLCGNGWNWVLENFFQPVVDAGLTRLFVSTPFGQKSLISDPPGALFQFDAYLTAREEVPNQNATREFVSGWQNFFATNAAAGKEVDAIVYIGSPRHDPDQTALINTPSAWWDRAYDIILPLLRAGFRQIGFDAGARAPIDSLDQALFTVLRNPSMRDPVRDARLINLIGNEKVEVFIEAVPTIVTGQTDLPLSLLDFDFMSQDPTRPGTANDIFFNHAEFTGEIIRILRGEQWDGDGEGLLATESILQDGHTASAAFQFLLRSENNGGASTGEENGEFARVDQTLDMFIDELFLPSLPTLVDLDPDDTNPDTAVYDILVQPNHGQLTLNPFHDDVYTYTPDPGYVGEDSFRYTVSDPLLGVATGRLELYINVPAPVNGDNSRDASHRRQAERRTRD